MIDTIEICMVAKRGIGLASDLFVSLYSIVLVCTVQWPLLLTRFTGNGGKILPSRGHCEDKSPAHTVQ